MILSVSSSSVQLKAVKEEDEEEEAERGKEKQKGGVERGVPLSLSLSEGGERGKGSLGHVGGRLEFLLLELVERKGSACVRGKSCVCVSEYV